MDVPCKDCLVLVMCMQRILRICGNNAPDIVEYSIRFKCQKLRKFIDYIDSSEFHKDVDRRNKFIKEINKVRVLFRIPIIVCKEIDGRTVWRYKI